jgi:hypothetical protein
VDAPEELLEGPEEEAEEATLHGESVTPAEGLMAAPPAGTGPTEL